MNSNNISNNSNSNSNSNNNTNKLNSGAGVQSTNLGTQNVKINNLFDRNNINNISSSNNNNASNPIAGLGHRFVQETPDGFVNIMGHTGDTGGDYLDYLELGQIAVVSSQANIIVNNNNMSGNNVYNNNNSRVDGRISPRGQTSQQELYFGVGATSQAGLKTLTGGGGPAKKRKQQQDDYVLPLVSIFCRLLDWQIIHKP